MLSTAVALLLWAGPGWACPALQGRGKTARFPSLRSPDKGAVAWSEAVSREKPRVDLGKLFVRDEKTKREKIVFEAEGTADGKIIRRGQLLEDNHHVFCVLDWSWDSRYLLIRESVGIADSDVGGDSYWIYDREDGIPRVVELSHLHRAVENYLARKGLFGQVGYEIAIRGWEGTNSHRVVFEAHPYFDVSTNFVAFWSLAPSGEDPKFLSEKEGEVLPKRFGEIVEAP